MKDFFRTGLARVLVDVSLDCVDPGTQLICAFLLEFFPDESATFLMLLKQVIGRDLTAPDAMIDTAIVLDELEEAKANYKNILKAYRKEAT
jgi:hypothetical protein